MMKKNMLSLIAATTVACSLLNPITAQAEVFYDVSRATEHAQQADDTVKQVMQIHDRERSSDLVTLWIAPYGECDEQGDGSEGKPFCDISQASDALDTMYAQGKARGDVDIRFKTGDNRVYKPQIGKRFGSFTFSPTAGHVVRFIPDWYQNVKDLDTINDSKMVKYHGNKKGEAQGIDSERGISIAPKINRGGTYQVSGFSFDTFINPLKLTVSQTTKDSLVDGDDPRAAYKNIRHSKNSAINNVLISHNSFTNIGSTYTSQGKNYISASLRMWGLTNSLIKDNTFTHGSAIREETSRSHVIYNYMTADNVYEGNTFKDNEYSGIRVRLSNDEIMRNNTFDNPKSPDESIGTWYQGGMYGEGGSHDNNSYAECRGNGPYYKDLKNTFKQSNSVQIRSLGDQKYCKDENRITAPLFAEGVQTGDFEYSIRWGESDTNGAGVKSYHVYVGDIDQDGKPIDEPKLVKTVNAETRELTMTKSMLEKAGMKPGEDFYYYIVAEGNSGWTSARTQLRTVINLDAKYKGREHYNVARVESFDRLMGGKKPEKSTFSYDLVSSQLDPSYGEKNVKPGEKVVQKISLDKLPVYTTFAVNKEEFPGKISVNAKTGELTVDTQGVEDGEYTINVEVQYGDWSKDVAPFVLRVGDPLAAVDDTSTPPSTTEETSPSTDTTEPTGEPIEPTGDTTEPTGDTEPTGEPIEEPTGEPVQNTDVNDKTITTPSEEDDTEDNSESVDNIIDEIEDTETKDNTSTPKEKFSPIPQKGTQRVNKDTVSQRPNTHSSIEETVQNNNSHDRDTDINSIASVDKEQINGSLSDISNSRIQKDVINHHSLGYHVDALSDNTSGYQNSYSGEVATSISNVPARKGPLVHTGGKVIEKTSIWNKIIHFLQL